MLAVAASFLLLTRVRIVRYYRFQELRVDKDHLKKQRSCNTQLGRLRPMAVISAILGLSALVLGLITGIRSHGIGANFWHKCSDMEEDSRAQKMQELSDRLVQFQKQCHDKANGNTTLTKCPGFEKYFLRDSNEGSNLSTYVGYLQRLEMHEGCTGFCKSTEPLAFEQRKKDLEDELTCAEVVGQHIWFAILLVALPSCFAGLFFTTIAVFLFEYEYL